MVSDLLNWDTLYIAGRLHKPINIFKVNDEVQDAYKINLENALKVALMLSSKEKITEEELYLLIAQISYM
jgi:translocator assembly and maintenance protein 41